MDWLWLAGVVAVAVFSAGSFFFALGETALFSLGKWRAEQLPQLDPRRGPGALKLLREPQELLATIVLGNSICNSALVAIALLAAIQYGWPLWLFLPLVFLFILLGCEIAPKAFAVRDPERWSLSVAQPLLLAKSATRPFRAVAQALNDFLIRIFVARSVKPQPPLTDAEYQELIEYAFQQGALGRSEKEIIAGIVELDQRTARDVMRPRSQMECLPDDMPVAEMIEAARRFRKPRIPLYDETPDTIIGILNVRALLLNPDPDLAEVIEFPSFVPETMNLLQLLQALQRQQRGLAVVLDEFGGTAGVVSMEDILEELIGPFRKRKGQSGFRVEKLGKYKWRLTGNVPIDEFRNEWPEIGEVEEVDTVGGLLVQLCEIVPAEGQSATFRGLRLTASKVEERRVHELTAEVVKKGAGG
ncbi:MAG TPA: hemolysin family protein [Methylomirabilota bacterium]|nr:hemolysin family protein [Methylomirabilota bacterium]